MLVEKKYLIALSKIPGVGPITLQKLVKSFGSASAAWQATSEEVALHNFSNNIVSTWPEKDKIHPDQEIAKIEKLGIIVLTLDDPRYPELLKQIYNPPPLLYLRGNFTGEYPFSLAIVGSRKCTNYGKQIAETIVADLAVQGITIVSGLALGLDALVHEATVKANGTALAVLGSGVDQVFPQTNYQLAEHVMQQGALMSEFSVGTPPQPSNFPMRNRIISGLSLGTLVIEAGESSGALITANFALEQNREVFAIPGSIFSKPSKGTNTLIQKGAKLVTCADDILDELNLEITRAQVEARQVIPDSPAEAQVLSLIERDPLHIDQIVRLSKKPTAEISSLLTMMEIKGKIKNLGGGQYGPV